MDVSLSQIKTDLENVVDDTLVIIGTFYKQALPVFQGTTNSCSTTVQFDECMQLMRNRNMKHIATKGTYSAYVTSKGIVLFGEDKTS